MLLISSAAHFAVCGCGKHGRLVTASGEESEELCSKEKARLALDEGIAAGKISAAEKGEALRQINVSSIANREVDATAIAHLGAALVDFAKSKTKWWRNPPHSKYVN